MFRHGEAAVEKFRTASPTVGLLSATRATEPPGGVKSHGTAEI